VASMVQRSVWLAFLGAGIGIVLVLRMIRDSRE